MKTLTELQEILQTYDEVILLELLNITSEDIVERFIDLIEENFEELIKEVDE